MNPACWFCQSPDCDGCVYQDPTDEEVLEE